VKLAENVIDDRAEKPSSTIFGRKREYLPSVAA
jgi:hypothetical protein